MNDDGAKYLSMAIVFQAIKDYRNALIRDNKREIYTLERWFRSDWFKELCYIDGDYLIKEIKKECVYEENY